MHSVEESQLRSRHSVGTETEKERDERCRERSRNGQGTALSNAFSRCLLRSRQSNRERKKREIDPPFSRQSNRERNKREIDPPFSRHSHRERNEREIKPPFKQEKHSVSKRNKRDRQKDRESEQWIESNAFSRRKPTAMPLFSRERNRKGEGIAMPNAFSRCLLRSRHSNRERNQRETDPPFSRHSNRKRNKRERDPPFSQQKKQERDRQKDRYRAMNGIEYVAVIQTEATERKREQMRKTARASTRESGSSRQSIQICATRVAGPI
jgi:hypothetical protein